MSSEHKSALWQAYRTIEALETRLERAPSAGREPVAIVGIGCRFPGGANSPEAFWKLICNGVDATRDMPAGRWNREEWYDPDPTAEGKLYVDRGGYLDEDPGLFDAEFFGISPREAAAMDPQQRLLLEVAWHALEDAQIPPDGLRESETGVYIGLMTNDYARLQVEHRSARHDAQYLGSGTGLGFPAGRLSYLLGCQGPSMVVATECSSSLVALHLASNALRDGECDLALAGGVNLILSPEPTVMLSRMRALSPDGRSKAFAAGADGYGRGEGCGIVALQRLSDARREGRRIYAVIHGSATNHDGPSGGLTIPSGPAQEKVIRKALAAAQVTPERIAYVEAHGTGTALGDPIEVHALGKIWGEAGAAPVAIGSVKTNIGHTEAAAGIAGVIKTALALQAGVIPASLHCAEPSPHVLWQNVAVAVAVKKTPWPNDRMFAGVSSFGLSGINAHVVLGRAPESSATVAKNRRGQQLLVLSARNDAGLSALVTRYAELLEGPPSPEWDRVCASAARGRAHLEYRLAVNASSCEEAVRRLRGGQHVRRVAGRVSPRAEAGIAFLFTGQGSQYACMGLELYESEPFFRETLDHCAELLKQEMPNPLLEVLFPAPGFSTPLDDTTCTQPALFALEYSLAHLWMRWGIRPRYVMGHSVGELAAACVAGVFSLEDGLRFTARRGRLMGGLPPLKGGMAAVLSNPNRVKEILRGDREVVISAINGPENVVISGDRVALARVLTRFQDAGIASKCLNVSHAFHSPALDEILPELEAAAREIRFSPPTMRTVAGLTGKWAGAEITTPDYWVRQAREAVRFSDGLLAIHAAGCRTYLEIGPRPVLTGLGAAMLEDTDCQWLASLSQGMSDREVLNQSAGKLFVSGHTLDWHEFYGAFAESHVDLPLYPFQQQRFWIQERARPERMADLGESLLGRRVESPLTTIQYDSTVGILIRPWLNDHRALGGVLLPAAAYVEMALAARGEERISASLTDIRLENPCKLPADRDLQLHTVMDGDELSIYSRNGQAEWSRHCAARIAESEEKVEPVDNLDALRMRIAEPVDVHAFYEDARARGLDYGPAFRGILAMWKGYGESLASIANTERLTIALDCVLQTAGAILHDESSTFIPTAFERIRWSGGQVAWAHARQIERTATGCKFNLTMYGPAGESIGAIVGMFAQKAQKAALHLDWLYTPKWVSAPRTVGSCAAGLREVTAAAEAEARQWSENANVDAYRAMQATLNAHAQAWIGDAVRGLASEEVVPEQRRLFEHLKRHPNGKRRERIGNSPSAQIVERCGSHLRQLLRGEIDALELLFPGGAGIDATRLYETDLAALGANARAREALNTIVQGLPAGRKIRVLEAGAGTAGTTSHLLSVLPGERSEYCFTDVSAFFVNRAKEKFRSYEFVRTQVFDIERDPLSQGFEPESFDVVVAANVVHALRDARQAVLHLHKLLAPGGILLLIEATQPAAWLDITFGLTSGWWRFQDDVRGNYPLIAADEWCALTKSSGFAAATATEFEGQSLILASKPGAKEPSRTPGELWLVFADRHGVGAALVERLRHDGCRVITVENGTRSRRIGADAIEICGASSSEVQLFAFEHLRQREVAGLVYLWALDSANASEAPNVPDMEVCLPLLNVLRNVARNGESLPIWVATRRAMTASPIDELDGWDRGQLWGLASAGRLEHPELGMTCVDLDGQSAANDASCLYAEIVSQDGERQVAYRGPNRLVARLSRAPGEGTNAHIRPHAPFRLETAAKGSLDALELRPTARPAPAAGEIEIEVRAAGLNFLDVLDALGALPFERGWLGGECAGIVTNVGAGVSEFVPGDEVVALAAASFGTHVIADARVTARKPQRLSFAESAAFPVAYLTARLAFEGVDLRPGMRVLIHAVSGGTGMAAWQIARLAGAEVFGTASPGKWEKLRTFGIEQPINSRTATFGIEVQARTFGRGVDVVLNSLTGEYISVGLRALGPGGLFLEIGKTEIWNDQQVADVRDDVTYRPVDLFAYSSQNPAGTGKLLRELAAALDDGSLNPLPITAFPMEKAIDAFRTLQQARHVGKIVLTIEPIRELMRSDATYLIAGGSSGLGRLTAGWLAEKGARDIVLISRRISEAGLQETEAELSKLGCRVTAFPADIADPESIKKLFSTLRSEGRVVRGVVHAAGVLDDGLLMEMEWPRFQRVLWPKAVGLWNLHQATQAMPLDFFVAYSSIASVFGSAGQTNHAAANAFLDSLMQWRRQRGLPGLSINWGPWKEFGAAARLSGVARDRYEQSGIRAIPTEEGRALLELLWRRTSPRLVVASIDWERFRARAGGLSLFEEFQIAEASSSVRNAPDLSGFAGAALNAKLEALVISELRVMLGQSDRWLPDDEQGFFGIGMDSLTSLELRNRLDKTLGTKLSATALFDFPTPKRLVEHLARQLEPATALVEAAARNKREEELNDLNTADLAELLSQKLSSLDALG